MIKTYLNLSRLRIILGLLWILDGFIELQPKLFSNFLASLVLRSSDVNQPSIIHSQVLFVINILVRHPAIFNFFFVLIQLGVGFLIINPKTVRLGLKVSILWGLFIWYFGEGLGNLLTHSALLISGAPGAALLYVIIAIGLYPYKKTSSKYLLNWFSISVVGYYLIGIVLILANSMNLNMAISSMVHANAITSTGLISKLQSHFANFIAGRSHNIAFLIIFIYLLLAGSVLMNSRIRSIGIYLGIIIALFFWIIGQNFGGVLVGTATDLNSGPLVILMLLGLRASPTLRLKLSEL